MEASTLAAGEATAKRNVPFDSALALVERESLLVVLSAVYAAGLLFQLPRLLLSDGWLTLVSGRELWRHGLPHADTLTLWSSGHVWVDQQWLAQLLFGGLGLLGGPKLALLFDAALVIGAFAAAVWAGRMLGGSSRTAAFVATFCAPVLITGWPLRAQPTVYILFVALIWLLAGDARGASRRVYAVLPVLVLWANLHGSVVLAAALVAVRGLSLLRTQRRRGVILISAPWLCVFASPYAFGLPHYYRSLLLNPLLGLLVPEWGRTTPSLTSANFYLVGFITVALLGRVWRSVTPFERAALLLLFANGMYAVRNMIWFALAAIVLVPGLLEPLLVRQGKDAPQVIRRGLPLVASAIAVLALLVALDKSPSAYVRAYPSAAAEAVAHAAATEPRSHVFADTAYADWLLWQQPQLRGRIVYDARYELLTNRRLALLYFWKNHTGTHWDTIGGCRAIVVVNQDQEALTTRVLLATHRATTLYRDAHVAVLARHAPCTST